MFAALLLGAGTASAQQSSVNFQPDITVGSNPPSYPTGTAKSGPADGQITLNWTPGAGGSSVQTWSVLYKKVSDTVYTNVADALAASTRTYTISGLDKSLGYDVRLTANGVVASAIAKASNVAAVAYTPPPPLPPPPPVITSAEGVTYSGNATEGFSLTPLGEEGNIVYRRRTIDLSVTRDECSLPGNPAVIISRSTLDRVREITFELKELSPHDPPPGFRMEGCTADIDPGVRLGQRETVTVCLPPAEIEGESHVHRYDGEWERLPSEPKTVNEEELLCGETNTFSLFGVFVPVIESAEGVSHSEDEEAFFLTPLGVGGSIVYGERTIDLSVTGDVASSNPAVIVPRNVLDRVEEITFELQGVSPHDPPSGLHLSGFAAEIDLGVTLGKEETVTVCLPQAGGDIYLYNDQLEEWEVLPSLLETVNGEELLCAETGGFSLTGVFVEETGGCAVASTNGEGTLRWQGVLSNLLLTISVLLLVAGKRKPGLYDRKTVSG